MKIIQQLVLCILNGGAVRATKFISPGYVMRVSRRLYRGRILKLHNTEILLTIGKPNYREREFIRKCVKAKEPFPIRKIQVVPYTVKRRG